MEAKESSFNLIRIILLKYSVIYYQMKKNNICI